MSRKKPPLAQPILPVDGVSTFLVSRLPSPLGSLCDNFSLRVIPRSPPFFSGGRRGISHCSENACAEGTLECGSASYRLCGRDWTAARRGGPRSTALRAFSSFLGARQPTGMSDCLENTQGEILRFQVRFGSDHRSPGFGPLPRLRDRNDSLGRVFIQTPGQRAPHSLATLSPTRQAVPSSGDLSPATRRDQALPLKAHDSPRSPGRRSS